MTDSIIEGATVLLHYDERRQWLVRVEKDKKFHTHKGIVDLSRLIDKPFGSRIESSLNQAFYALRPTTFDHIMHSARRTQIMYPKDIGLIILKLSLSSGRQVLEIGTGSGAMTLAAATAVRTSGHVHTYEAREEFVEIASKNLMRGAVSEYVTIHRANAVDGVAGENFDAAILDVGDPWPILPIVHRALAGGAPLVSFSPTVNQIERTVLTLAQIGFMNIQTFESFIREIRVDAGKTRPASIMVGHTGYMTFAQKICVENESRS
jgi:tRNA (adenine57-N1/adenine58-N1)-methyltransferase